MDLESACVGFIGLGNMGGGMASRLSGLPRLIVNDANPDAANRVAEATGAKIASGLASFAEADFVVLMLPDSSVVDAVLLGSTAEPGLLQHLKRGSYVVDMSSSDPLRTQANAEVAQNLGIHLLDAPVTGGVGGAESGNLSVFVGADPSDLAAVEPLLEKFAKNIQHVGPVGSGHTTKAFINLMSGVILACGSEIVATATEMGMDVGRLFAAIAASTGSSFVAEKIFPSAIIPRTYDIGFSMALMTKDVAMAHSLMDSLGLEAQVSTAARRLWTSATASVGESSDCTMIAEHVAKERSHGK